MRRYIRELRSRAVNLPAVLLILTVISASSTLAVGNSIGLAVTTSPESLCYYPAPELLRDSSYVVPVLQNALICVLFPFTGWLADTALGRRFAIQLSIWCCWIGSLLHLISLCIQYSNCGSTANVSKYGVSVIGLLFIMFGSASSLANIPAFGLDQLEDKSNASVRSFIHWFVWGLFVGFGVNYTNFVTQSLTMLNLLLGTTLGVFIINSIVLCLYGCFYDQLLPGNLTTKKNPYKRIYDVIKYTKWNKHPVKRSAFTYWSHRAPTRIDFAKHKYGGPFTEEEVENVKTFWRIFFLLLCLFGFYIPYYAAYLGAFSIINSFQGAITTVNGYGSYLLWIFAEESIILIVPIFELLIIPFFPKSEYFLLRPLRAIAVCYLLLLFGLATLFIITTVGYLTTPNYVPCLTISATNVVQLSYIYFLIPIFLAGVTSGPRFIFTLEFIISQSPADMSGMLTGSFWLIQAVYIDIGAIIQIPFAAATLDGPGILSCTFWILLLQLLIGVVGFIIFLIVARKYKARKKDDDYNYRRTIEEVYERALEAEHEESLSSITACEYVLIDAVDPAINQYNESNT